MFGLFPIAEVHIKAGSGSGVNKTKNLLSENVGKRNGTLLSMSMTHHAILCTLDRTSQSFFLFFVVINLSFLVLETRLKL